MDLDQKILLLLCKQKDGKGFGAKPVGDRELKAKYMEDMDNIIGKMGTVKFFDWTVDGIPSQPIFQVIRDLWVIFTKE